IFSLQDKTAGILEVWRNVAANRGQASKGILKVNVAPLLSLLFLAQILPPCASIMLLDMNNPRPVPVWDLLVNFVKSLDTISGSIPVPLSLTETMISPSLLSAEM